MALTEEMTEWLTEKCQNYSAKNKLLKNYFAKPNYLDKRQPRQVALIIRGMISASGLYEPLVPKDEYRDRKSKLSEADYDAKLKTSTTLYVGTDRLTQESCPRTPPK